MFLVHYIIFSIVSPYYFFNPPTQKYHPQHLHQTPKKQQYLQQQNPNSQQQIQKKQIQQPNPTSTPSQPPQMNQKNKNPPNNPNSPLIKQHKSRINNTLIHPHIHIPNLNKNVKAIDRNYIGKSGTNVRELMITINGNKNTARVNRSEKILNPTSAIAPDKNIDYSKRFDQLLRICQSLSTRQLEHPTPSTKQQSNQNTQQTNNLFCTDQTIQSMLQPHHQLQPQPQPHNQYIKTMKQRQRCVKSSRSYHQFELDLPQIKEKQLQYQFQQTEQDIKDKTKNIKSGSLTQRNNTSTQNLQKYQQSTTIKSTQNLKTSRQIQLSSGHKTHRSHHSHDRDRSFNNSSSNIKNKTNYHCNYNYSYKRSVMNTQITPFQKMLNTSHIGDCRNSNKENWNTGNKSNSKTKIKVNIDIDVKKLLNPVSKKQSKILQEKMMQNRKIYSKSSMNYYNRSCHA